MQDIQESNYEERKKKLQRGDKNNKTGRERKKKIRTKEEKEDGEREKTRRANLEAPCTRSEEQQARSRRFA